MWSWLCNPSPPFLPLLQYIHRDIRAENILLFNPPGKGSKLVAKLADFGMHTWVWMWW